MANSDVSLTLKEAVAEVLQSLTGMDLEYAPELDRFQAITRTLNRALRAVALEHEWAFYASVEEAGNAVAGTSEVELNSKLRPRIVNDDAVRLVDSEGRVVRWAYFLPRDALHKYGSWTDLRVAVTRTTLTFSRPFTTGEAGLRIQVPVMREPKMFRLPPNGQDVPRAILNQPIDFDYPDLVIAKACQLYAETDPLMQPRVQTLEAKYKDLMYQLIERDERATDSPYLNDFIVPVEGSLNYGRPMPWLHGHPHSDERW